MTRLSLAHRLRAAGYDFARGYTYGPSGVVRHLTVSRSGKVAYCGPVDGVEKALGLEVVPVQIGLFEGVRG